MLVGKTASKNTYNFPPNPKFYCIFAMYLKQNCNYNEDFSYSECPREDILKGASGRLYKY